MTTRVAISPLLPLSANLESWKLARISTCILLFYDRLSDDRHKAWNSELQQANASFLTLLHRKYIYIFLHKLKNQRRRISVTLSFAPKRSLDRSFLTKDLSDECFGAKLTQSYRESMRRLWFFNLCMLSSATTGLSTLCQGRAYLHTYTYFYIFVSSKKEEIHTVILIDMFLDINLYSF